MLKIGEILRLFTTYAEKRDRQRFVQMAIKTPLWQVLSELAIYHYSLTFLQSNEKEPKTSSTWS